MPINSKAWYLLLLLFMIFLDSEFFYNNRSKVITCLRKYHTEIFSGYTFLLSYLRNDNILHVTQYIMHQKHMCGYRQIEGTILTWLYIYTKKRQCLNHKTNSEGVLLLLLLILILGAELQPWSDAKIYRKI